MAQRGRRPKQQAGPPQLQATAGEASEEEGQVLKLVDVAIDPFAEFEFLTSQRPRPKKQTGNVNITTKGVLSIAPDLVAHLVQHKDNGDLEDKGWVRVGVKRVTRELLLIPGIKQEEGVLRIARPKGQRYIVNATSILKMADMLPPHNVSVPGRWIEFTLRSGLIFSIPKD